jgi:hypothetical protein
MGSRWEPDFTSLHSTDRLIVAKENKIKTVELSVSIQK